MLIETFTVVAPIVVFVLVLAVCARAIVTGRLERRLERAAGGLAGYDLPGAGGTRGKLRSPMLSRSLRIAGSVWIAAEILDLGSIDEVGS